MYFGKFLETCTIGWVSFCEGGVGVGKRNAKNAFFFEKFYRGHDLPHPRRSLYTPPVETPAHSSAPGTAEQHRQQRRPCQIYQGGQVPGQTAARTLDTLHWSALDTRQATPGRSGRRRWRACACMLRVQRFYVLVRLILNILLTCTFNHV